MLLKAGTYRLRVYAFPGTGSPITQLFTIRVRRAASGLASRPARETSRAGENDAVDSLRGHLLVAGPGLDDPNFRRTVVLVGEHGDEGAMGVVLNRVSPVTVEDAVPPMAALVGPDELVYVGGPVQPQAVVVLADFVDPRRAEALVVDDVGFLPGELDDAADVGELRSVRVFAGYAGWAAGQLEGELEEGSWLVFPARARRRVHERPGRALERCPPPRGRRARAFSRCFPTIHGSTERTEHSTNVNNSFGLALWE